MLYAVCCKKVCLTGRIKTAKLRHKRTPAKTGLLCFHCFLYSILLDSSLFLCFFAILYVLSCTPSVYPMPICSMHSISYISFAATSFIIYGVNPIYPVSLCISCIYITLPNISRNSVNDDTRHPTKAFFLFWHNYVPPFGRELSLPHFDRCQSFSTLPNICSPLPPWSFLLYCSERGINSHFPQLLVVL
jgi:hypothetical protein